MEYFSRAWALGDVSDEEAERAEENYRDYVSSLDRTSPVWRFTTTVNLNDAYVDRVLFNAGKVSLKLLTGNLQRGYWHTELTYGGARILFGQHALERAVQDRPTEIWYDEFSGRWPEMVHRFLLVEPGGVGDPGEFHIGFSDFSYTEAPANERTLSPL